MRSNVDDMDEPGKRPTDSPARGTLRRIAIGLTVPLLAAAILWWAAGTDMAQTRWISIGVIAVALAGWYLSRDRGAG